MISFRNNQDCTFFIIIHNSSRSVDSVSNILYGNILFGNVVYLKDYHYTKIPTEAKPLGLPKYRPKYGLNGLIYKAYLGLLSE